MVMLLVPRWVSVMPALGSPEVKLRAAELVVEANEQVPHGLTIRSSNTRFDLDMNKGWFEGEVVAEKGDLRLQAKRAEVDIGPANSIKKAVAEGGVVVSQGESRASGERAVMEGDRLVLTGSPVLDTPQHRMVGSQMVFTVGQKTVECKDCSITLKSGSDP